MIAASHAEALREAARQLAEKSDTARLDAELLLAHACGVSRSDLLLGRAGAQVPPVFGQYVARRLAREPVAYILGTQEFYGREFLVNRDVLIPRSDSESVVEAALACLPHGPARLLDCGTGSGALLLTLLAERDQAQGVGIDRSSGALTIAQANVLRLGLAERCRLEQRDWHLSDWAAGLGPFDLIIANPPYVETGADLEPDVRDFEPASALFAGIDGLDDYRILIPQLPAMLHQDGCAVLEIGATQAAAVSRIAQESSFTVQVHSDLAHRPRAVVLRFGLGKPAQAV